METLKTEGDVVDTKTNEGEGSENETISIPKKDYDTLNQTLGSYKKQIKDFKKASEETKETLQTKPDDAVLQKLERMALRGAGVTHSDDIDLARATAKKWGMDIDEVLIDEDFQSKLARQQTSRSNATATSNIRGGAGNSQAKNTPEYWIAKGAPPSREEVPDSSTRRKIAQAFVKSGSNKGKKFYND